jgi:hypothetical protein
MEISQAIVMEFLEAVREEYDRELTFADAHSILYDMAVYFDTLAKIRHRETLQRKT